MNGSDKAKLIIETQPLLQHKYNLFRDWFEDVIVVCNRKRQSDYPGMNVVVDEQEGQGPLMGLYTGLKASRHPVNFVTACDMPFIREALVRLLMKYIPGQDAVVPKLNGYWEPLLAVYHQNLLPAIRHHLSLGHRKLSSFFSEARIFAVTEEKIKAADPDGVSFFNVNTLADLKRAKQIHLLAQKDYGQRTVVSA
jgi:molybdopterin-guanine dinucleotide biosynthesis protein A